MVVGLGLRGEAAAQRARTGQTRDIARAVLRRLAAHGVDVHGRVVLDLGAGLGAMSEELLLAGARVCALEPGEALAALTQRRLSRHGGEFRLIKTFGEAVPLPDRSVDLVVSLQVLEHKWALMRPLARATGAALPQRLDDARHYFAVGVYELFDKPARPAPADGSPDGKL